MGFTFGEANNWHKGRSGPAYYAEDLKAAKEEKANDAKFPKIIKAEDMVWEDSPHGRIKHIARTEMNPHDKDVDAYIQELAPGGKSGKHRHMAEEFMFVLEGKGYSLHWDVNSVIGDTMEWEVEEEPKRFEWEVGDWVYVPVNTVHQHFNSDPNERARFISATSRVFKWLGFNDLEQVESV